MSTIKVSTVSNLAGTNSTSADNVISGSAKAWVNFNGTGTVAIRAAYNVSSITDNGTGDYTMNFTTAMPDADYAVCGISPEARAAVDQALTGVGIYTDTGNYGPANIKTTTALRLISKYVYASGQGDHDVAQVNIAIFR